MKLFTSCLLLLPRGGHFLLHCFWVPVTGPELHRNANHRLHPLRLTRTHKSPFLVFQYKIHLKQQFSVTPAEVAALKRRLQHLKPGCSLTAAQRGHLTLSFVLACWPGHSLHTAVSFLSICAIKINVHTSHILAQAQEKLHLSIVSVVEWHDAVPDMSAFCGKACCSELKLY